MFEVVIVRSNSIVFDPRVRKISRSLNKRYSTFILGWNREGLSKETTSDFFTNLRLFNLRAPFGKRILLFYLPLFWIWVFFNLIIIRPKVVHACDLDLVAPCYLYKIIFRKKLVFDVFDRYAMTYVPPRHRSLYAFITYLEEFFSGRSDVLVNVSERLLGTFRKRPPKCSIIMNCAEDQPIERIRGKSIDLKIFHAGGIRRTRGLEQLAASVKDLSNVELVIAGRVVHEELKREILSVSNVKYKGILSPDDLLSLEAQSDACVAFYDPKDPINEFSIGNKLFESMMLGLPIITNVAPEIIAEVSNGFVVNYNDENQIKRAIVTLRDDLNLRQRLGDNARAAFVKKYNWGLMEQELYRLYDQLLADKK